MIWIAVAVVALLVIVGAVVLLGRAPGGGGAHFPPGTRAFEAHMSLGIIADMIAAREAALPGTNDEAKRAVLERQLANLRKQEQIHRATVEARDLSPGKMSIGVNPDSDGVD